MAKVRLGRRNWNKTEDAAMSVLVMVAAALQAELLRARREVHHVTDASKGVRDAFDRNLVIGRARAVELEVQSSRFPPFSPTISVPLFMYETTERFY